MATYFNPNAKSQFDLQSLKLPDFAKRFLVYLQIEKNTAPRTVFNYAVSIRIFLRWVRCLAMGRPLDQADSVDVSDMKLEEITSLTTSDIYDFLSYCTMTRHNSAKSRSAKLVAINSFLDYLRRRDESGMMKENPASDISAPKKEESLPKFLTLMEAKTLLSSVDGPAASRDYCILLWFLSCGMRLTELVTIDLKDIKDDTLRIRGKGRKERVLHLNKPCLDALDEYLIDRQNYKKIVDEKALFISNERGTRLTGRRVEQIVDKYIAKAGLQDNGFSAHKLRHSAATLLYKNGTGIVEIQQILGHKSVQTTGIYTHTSGEQIAGALDDIGKLFET